jgi:hypothetical protein
VTSRTTRRVAPRGPSSLPCRPTARRCFPWGSTCRLSPLRRSGLPRRWLRRPPPCSSAAVLHQDSGGHPTAPLRCLRLGQAPLPVVRACRGGAVLPPFVGGGGGCEQQQPPRHASPPPPLIAGRDDRVTARSAPRWLLPACTATVRSWFATWSCASIVGLATFGVGAPGRSGLCGFSRRPYSDSDGGWASWG